MKNKIALLLTLLFPILVSAKVYNDFNASKVYTNKYISNFKNYSDYIVTDTQLYGYNGNIYFDIDFIKGGFLSREEFLISKDQNGSTYLFNGLNYWTMTKSNSQYYIVDKNSENNLKLLNSTEMSGARITEYVKSGTKIYGSGTYQDPWKFIEVKNIRVTYNNNGGTGCTYKTVKQGNKYGTLCTPRKDRYTFEGWYSDSNLTTEVNENTIITSEEDIVLKAKWGGGEYTITYNANGGSVTPTNKSVTFGNAVGTLPVPSYPGYIFDGWYTAVTGGTKITENTIYNVTNDSIYYAKYIACSSGYYCPGENQKNACPVGYTSDSGATAQNKCYINVSAGKYLATAKGTSTITCAVSTYKEAHAVYYGSTSSCISCPTGYTSNSGATAQNKCYINVSAGKYLATAKGTSTIACAATTYKEAHAVYYGSTSECISCPGNYVSSPAAEAQSWCYISVPANKYIATSGSSTLSSCAAGYNKEAHVVNYGGTSSCDANTYTISYNANGGSGRVAMSSTSCTYGSNCTLRSNSYSRTNYTFKGWSTSSTAATATYTNGSSVSNLTTTNGGTVTLYAVWKYSPPSCSCSYYYYYKVNTSGGVNCRAGAGTNYSIKTALTNGTLFVPSGGDYASDGSYWYYDLTHSCYIHSDYVAESSSSYGDNGCCGSSSGGSSSSCSLYCPSTIRYGVATTSGIEISGCSNYYVYSSDCAIKSSSGIGQNCLNDQYISINDFPSKYINAYYYTNNSNVNSASASTNNASHTLTIRNSSGTIIDSCTYRIN